MNHVEMDASFLDSLAKLSSERLATQVVREELKSVIKEVRVACNELDKQRMVSWRKLKEPMTI